MGSADGAGGTAPSGLLGGLLLALSGAGRALLTGSGVEANETAVGLSLLTGRSRVIAAAGSFHGPAVDAAVPTGRPVRHVPFGDAEALSAAVNHDTALVILEPIQSGNGVVVPPPGYLAAAREICTTAGALLALDEVRTGLGRTGYWFHYQSEGVDPDLVTLGRNLTNGLPLGACLAFGRAAALLTTGTYENTAADSASCAAALTVIRTIAGRGVLDHVKRVGDRLRGGLEMLGHPWIAEVRGAGLLLGVELTEPVAGPVADLLRREGFPVAVVRPAVIRIAPPLIFTIAQADALVAELPRAMDSVSAGSARSPLLLRGAA
ncbi:aminotransferase class III-fold pyridoxal phosphate-dependent enzyme [Paractinoplanes lichenicola]|uniref:Aminotransferase class III-fold pyridoxal phosphate-dependent enzyme n=1 Tax=Paractinoplanes lichenicola TaxID=2802976 RepID=A0ABS1W0Q2_9ACTN|nr:aminotransferase class III-fold pyridoxal phosphate-dependent enzyme [Actinoplanes lichenicola]MBL7260314.1 aminotransferase class III-fold pyridoxal phosphate-dependent enzyme [Actinoplanes lichenicola]